jgi:hypothetical protein
MRETLSFEVRLRRFEVWRSAVVAVAFVAVAVVAAWAWSIAATRSGDDVVWIYAVAAVLAAGTIVAAASLARTPAGVLACGDGGWSFARDSQATVEGRLTVALDWGAFLLLRIDSGSGARLWVPVQRRGLERDWHALRCALYSPPASAAPASAAPLSPPE